MGSLITRWIPVQPQKGSHSVNGRQNRFIPSKHRIRAVVGAGFDAYGQYEEQDERNKGFHEVPPAILIDC